MGGVFAWSGECIYVLFFIEMKSWTRGLDHGGRLVYVCMDTSKVATTSHVALSFAARWITSSCLSLRQSHVDGGPFTIMGGGGNGSVDN